MFEEAFVAFILAGSNDVNDRFAELDHTSWRVCTLCVHFVFVMTRLSLFIIIKTLNFDLNLCVNK